MIHQYWSGPNKPASILNAREWNDDSVPLEALDLAHKTVHLVDPRDSYRHRANIVRLYLLYFYGGMWADYDMEFVGSLTDLPSVATAAHRPGVRCNCWMAFPAGHQALEQALEAIAALPEQPPRRSPFVSGENLLSRLWGSEVAEVLVYVDIDGRVNEEAPKVLIHRGASSNLPFSLPAVDADSEGQDTGKVQGWRV